MIDKSIKVSIIVAVYNTIQFLEQCVHSLMTQTYDNFEIIFIDDASTDSSYKLLKTILSEYPNLSDKWSIIRNEKNMGIGYCRRIAMQQATGEYMIHVDSDDYVDNTFIEKLVKKAQNDHADIVICNTADVVNDKVTFNNIENITDKSELIKRLLIGTFHNSLWNKLIKSSIIVQNELYPEDIFRIMEDKSIMFRCVYFANKIAYLNPPLYYYRKKRNSLTGSGQWVLPPMLDRLIELVDDFFTQHQADETINQGIKLFKIGAAATLLLYKNEVKKDIIKNASIREIFSNTYIPRYYKYALICSKYHFGFIVKLLQLTIRIKFKSDDRRKKNNNGWG
jgi:glycosyltransferase involved in cell wall biosynthesis